MFAINVFKVQEVLKLPNWTLMPKRHPVVVGDAFGNTVPVINGAWPSNAAAHCRQKPR